MNIQGTPSSLWNVRMKMLGTLPPPPLRKYKELHLPLPCGNEKKSCLESGEIRHKMQEPSPADPLQKFRDGKSLHANPPDC